MNHPQFRSVLTAAICMTLISARSENLQGKNQSTLMLSGTKTLKLRCSSEHLNQTMLSRIDQVHGIFMQIIQQNRENNTKVLGTVARGLHAWSGDWMKDLNITVHASGAIQNGVLGIAFVDLNDKQEAQLFRYVQLRCVLGGVDGTVRKEWGLGYIDLHNSVLDFGKNESNPPGLSLDESYLFQTSCFPVIDEKLCNLQLTVRRSRGVDHDGQYCSQFHLSASPIGGGLHLDWDCPNQNSVGNPVDFCLLYTIFDRVSNVYNCSELSWDFGLRYNCSLIEEEAKDCYQKQPNDVDGWKIGAITSITSIAVLFVGLCIFLYFHFLHHRLPFSNKYGYDVSDDKNTGNVTDGVNLDENLQTRGDEDNIQYGTQVEDDLNTRL